MPSIGMIFTGAATTGAGAALANTNGQPVTSTSELLHQAAVSMADGDNPDGGDNGNLHRATTPEEHLLTPQAILAIAKSWGVGTYNPPTTNCPGWLGRIRNLCTQYGVPVAQRTPCAMYHMRADCRAAAYAAECYDMTWNDFAEWLRLYDRKLFSNFT